MRFCGTLILALSNGLISVANTQEIKKGHRPSTIEGKVVATSQETVIDDPTKCEIFCAV